MNVKRKRTQDPVLDKTDVSRASKSHYESGWFDALTSVIGIGTCCGLLEDLIRLIASYIDLRRIVFVAGMDTDHSLCYYLVSFHPKDNNQRLYIHKRLDSAEFDMAPKMFGVISFQNVLWMAGRYAQNHLVPVLRLAPTHIQGIVSSKLALRPYCDDRIHAIEQDIYRVGTYGQIGRWEWQQTRNLGQWLKKDTLMVPVPVVAEQERPSGTVVYANRYLIIMNLDAAAQVVDFVRYDSQTHKWSSVHIPFSILLFPDIRSSMVLQSIMVNDDREIVLWLTSECPVIVRLNLELLTRFKCWQEGRPGVEDQLLGDTTEFTTDNLVTRIQTNPTLLATALQPVTLAALDHSLYVIPAMIKEDENDDTEDEDSPPRIMQCPPRVHEYNLLERRWTNELPESLMLGPLAQRLLLTPKMSTKTLVYRQELRAVSTTSLVVQLR